MSQVNYESTHLLSDYKGSKIARVRAEYQYDPITDTYSLVDQDTKGLVLSLKKNEQLFEKTETPFGIIQREAERLGLSSQTHKRGVETGKACKDHVTTVLPGKVEVVSTESAIGVDVKAEAAQSILQFNNKNDPNKPDYLPDTQVQVGRVSAAARAGFGLSGVGASAGVSAHAVSTSVGPVSAKFGLGLNTGIFISPTQFEVTVAGTGVRVGEYTGVSVAGNSVDVDVGKIVEDLGNTFVKHDPHKQLRDKIAEKGTLIEDKIDPNFQMRGNIGKIYDKVDSVTEAIETNVGPKVSKVSKGVQTVIEKTVLAGSAVKNAIRGSKKSENGSIEDSPTHHEEIDDFVVISHEKSLPSSQQHLNNSHHEIDKTEKTIRSSKEEIKKKQKEKKKKQNHDDPDRSSEDEFL